MRVQMHHYQIFADYFQFYLTDDGVQAPMEETSLMRTFAFVSPVPLTSWWSRPLEMRQCP